MVIYFDLDDTLYRLYDPFYKAYQKVFHEDLDIYALWKQSRIYSNEIYPKYLNKLITKDDNIELYNIMHAINIKDKSKRYSFIYDTLSDYIHKKY